MVLLNDAWMCMRPLVTTFFSFFLNVFFLPVFAGALAMNSSLGLAGRFLLVGDCASTRSLPGARVGMRTLSANRQAAAMAEATIGAHFDETLDVHRNFLAQIAFDCALVFNQGSDLVHLVLGQIRNLLFGTHARPVQ